MKCFKLVFVLMISLSFLLAQTNLPEKHQGYVVEQFTFNNPNPLLCGISEVCRENTRSWISGIYEAELI